MLQAYLPEALAAMQQLTAWALARRSEGGAGIKVRLVKGANLAMERVDAIMHGWPLATWGDKAAHRRPLQAGARLVVHAAAHGCGPHRRRRAQPVRHRLRLAAGEVSRGRAPGRLRDAPRHGDRAGGCGASGCRRARAVHARGAPAGVRLRDLVSHPPSPGEREPGELHVRRVRAGERSLGCSRGRSSDSGRPCGCSVPRSRGMASRARTACRTAAAASRQAAGERRGPAEFRNEPDTDPSIAANRAWGREILRRALSSELGASLLARVRVTEPGVLEQVIAATGQAGEEWGRRRGHTRAQVLLAAAESLAARRGGAHRGDGLRDRHDHRRGRRRGERGGGLRALLRGARPGARPRRERAVLAVPAHRGRAVVELAGLESRPAPVLAALAAGSGVILKPAPQARRCAAVLVEALWSAGVPREVLPSSTSTRPARNQTAAAGARAAAHRASRCRPGHPHRRPRDGETVPFLAARPAAHRRDGRQERDHRHPRRRPRPRGDGCRAQRLRARGPGVLRREPRHPGRLGRERRSGSGGSSSTP